MLDSIILQLRFLLVLFHLFIFLVIMLWLCKEFIALVVQRHQKFQKKAKDNNLQEAFDGANLTLEQNELPMIQTAQI